MEIGGIVSLVLLALAVITVLKAVVSVRQGWQYTVERFGRYTKTLTPGLHLLIPYIDRVGHKMNMRERVIDVPSQAVITKDNAMVTADAVVFIQVIDPRKAAYEVNNLENAIQNLSLTNVRSVALSMTLCC